MSNPFGDRQAASVDKLDTSSIGRLLGPSQRWGIFLSLVGFVVNLLVLVVLVAVLLTGLRSSDEPVGADAIIRMTVAFVGTTLLFGLPSIFILAFALRVARFRRLQRLVVLPPVFAALRRVWVVSALVSMLAAMVVVASIAVNLIGLLTDGS